MRNLPSLFTARYLLPPSRRKDLHNLSRRVTIQPSQTTKRFPPWAGENHQLRARSVLTTFLTTDRRGTPVKRRFKERQRVSETERKMLKTAINGQKKSFWEVWDQKTTHSSRTAHPLDPGSEHLFVSHGTCWIFLLFEKRGPTFLFFSVGTRFESCYAYASIETEAGNPASVSLFSHGYTANAPGGALAV